MLSPPSPIISSRLEKAAIDNGFDLVMARAGEWLGFASTQCPMRLWLTATSEGALVAAFSLRSVAPALGELGTPYTTNLPPGAVNARTVADVPSLHQLVRRSFQLGKTLPDALLNRFIDTTKSLPRTTEAERLVVQRVGQDVFRAGLLEYWEGRCAITGLAVPELLRASHIKPWADCESDAERLDVYNGLLLAAHLDALFDGYLMTFNSQGVAVLSPRIDATARAQLGLLPNLNLRSFTIDHEHFLSFHRKTFAALQVAGTEKARW
jgi:putative restriction endonuclease